MLDLVSFIWYIPLTCTLFFYTNKWIWYELFSCSSKYIILIVTSFAFKSSTPYMNSYVVNIDKCLCTFYIIFSIGLLSYSYITCYLQVLFRDIILCSLILMMLLIRLHHQQSVCGCKHCRTVQDKQVKDRRLNQMTSLYR